MADTAVPAPPPSRTLLGHPIGLFYLFATEMWERFSYYGMRSLLVLYMVDHLFLRPDLGQTVLGFDAVRRVLESAFGPLEAQPLASQIYGLYTGFVYLTPLFGGILADRVLGQRRTVVIGCLLMAIGHFLMASERLFFPALLFLVAGNGAFKPNISTQVGSLYPPGDPRRDGAYTIFYMGVNLGAFLSPLVCGTLGQTVGWHWGFGAAGVGMLLGLVIYLIGQKHLAPDLVSLRRAGGAAKPSAPMTREEWVSVIALSALCVLNIVFWGCYEQQGNTLQLWADRNTDWHFLGLTIPSTWYQSFNPALIFLLAPLLDRFWRRQAARGSESSSVSKMAVGCYLLGLSFVIMILAAWGTAPDARRSVLWLVGTSLVITVGELYLSPVGLSLVSKVAPARMVSMMMGVWYMSNFFGNYLSGFLGTWYERMTRVEFFVMLALLGIAAGLAITTIGRPVNRALSRQERAAKGAAPVPAA